MKFVTNNLYIDGNFIGDYEFNLSERVCEYIDYTIKFDSKISTYKINFELNIDNIKVGNSINFTSIINNNHLEFNGYCVNSNDKFYVFQVSHKILI